ncbi:MAG TPA: hypothetical protein VFV87_14710 [Pirellulaceae bacterium]|nr:hypothetical protein [Pirellulaceae bacterium]
MRTAILASLGVIVLIAPAQRNCISEDQFPVPVAALSDRFALIGKLHVPLGKLVTVQGVVVEGPFKGYEGGPNLRVQRIGAKYTQEDIQIPLSDMTQVVPEKRVEIKIGETYEFEGYETGGYVGIPSEVWKGGPAWVQTTNHYFRLDFNYVRGKQIDPIRFQPYDFQGRRALFEGVARNREGVAIMDGEKWTVIVDATMPWPERLVGKHVETLGLHNPTKESKVFLLVDGTWRPVSLDDQIGQRVELRGTARSFNDIWWFRFRDTDMYVEDMDQLPGWSNDCWGKPIVIRGVLDKSKLPRLDQISLRSDRGLRDHYIVRKAQWEPLSTLLSPERSSGEPGVADLTKLRNDDER